MPNGWLKHLVTAGPIGAVVAFLLLQSAGVIPSIASEIRVAVERHDNQATQQLKVLEQIAAQQREAARLLQVQCLKTAQTDADRRACLGAN
jgi:hypothetical protein